MSDQDASASSARFIREDGRAAELAGLIEPVLEGLGFRLVRIVVGGRDEPNVQIMAERPDGSISIDDCEFISKQISPVLDVADPIQGAYRLEVSSPGIDRPLVRPSDFEDWAGYEAKIELSTPIDGRKRFKGRLEGFEDGEIRLDVDLDQIGQIVLGLPIALVADARLVLTDDLIREALNRSKAKSKGGLSDGSEPPQLSETESLSDTETQAEIEPQASSEARPTAKPKTRSKPKTR